MILSIDPGLNVGLAYRFDNSEWGTQTLESQPDWDLNMSVLVKEIMRRMPLVVVIESFVGRQMFSTYSIETTEMVGAVRGVCLALGITFRKQTPMQRVTLVPTATMLLTERKTAIKGFKYTNHEVSALAHLLTYERRTEKLLHGSASGIPS